MLSQSTCAITEVTATLLWLLTTSIGLFFNAENYTTHIVFEKGFKTPKSSFHASLKLEVSNPFSSDIECVEAREQFELFWTSTAPESPVVDHFVSWLQSKSEANDNPIKVKQFDEEEIFGYHTKATMFADIDNKLMRTIFSKESVAK